MHINRDRRCRKMPHNAMKPAMPRNMRRKKDRSAAKRHEFMPVAYKMRRKAALHAQSSALKGRRAAHPHAPDATVHDRAAPRDRTASQSQPHRHATTAQLQSTTTPQAKVPSPCSATAGHRREPRHYTDGLTATASEPRSLGASGSHYRCSRPSFRKKENMNTITTRTRPNT